MKIKSNKTIFIMNNATPDEIQQFIDALETKHVDEIVINKSIKVIRVIDGEYFEVTEVLKKMKKVETIWDKTLQLLGIEQTDKTCQYCGRPVYESNDYMCDKEVCQLRREIHTQQIQVASLKAELSKPNISMASIINAIAQYTEWNGEEPMQIHMSPDLYAELLKNPDFTHSVQTHANKRLTLFGMDIMPATTKIVGWYIA